MDPVSLSVLAIYGVLMIWEALFPARQLPKIKFWKIRGLTAFAFFFYLSSYLPLFTDPYLEAYRVFDLTGLGALGGGAVGVLLYEFGVYVWHRALHTSNFLWRAFHQMHHSAERLDTYGAFYFSPLDMIGWTVLGSLCFALLVGLSPQAITVTLLVTNFLGMFQHANINTPRWLGYIIQRPESHTVHHAKGIHKHNYSDLPIFDILFGTFENPKNYGHQTGFYYGASAKVLQMLSFKDLNKQKEKEGHKSSGRKPINKGISLLLIALLTFSCNRDDGAATAPDPVQENPQQEEPIPVPVLNAVSPLNGPKNTVVTVEGANFGTEVDSVGVFFNGKEGEVLQVQHGQIKAEVPAQAYSGTIKVVIRGTELEGPEFAYVLSETRVSTLAGSTVGSSDGIGKNAEFAYPTGTAVDGQGNVYVADSGNHQIRIIAPDGTVGTFAGSTKGFADGMGTTAQFDAPYGVAVDRQGQVYVADANNHRVRKISPEGMVTTLAGSTMGSADGVGTEAQFNFPRGVAVDLEGNVYVADTKNLAIRKVTPDGTVTRIGNQIMFSGPSGVAVNHEGALYVVDSNSHRIYLIAPNGEAGSLAGRREGDTDGVGGAAEFRYPRGLGMDTQGNSYVADEGNHKIRKVTPDGTVTTYAGGMNGNEDGSVDLAQFNYPYALSVDAQGNLYVADTANHRIRKITQE